MPVENESPLTDDQQHPVRGPEVTTPVRRGTSNRNDRGSARDRRNRKQYLLDTFGDSVTVLCAYGCGTVLDYFTLTVDRHPVPGCQGGTYRRGNIRPACAPCNSSHGGGLRNGVQPPQPMPAGWR